MNVVFWHSFVDGILTYLWKLITLYGSCVRVLNLIILHDLIFGAKIFVTIENIWQSLFDSNVAWLIWDQSSITAVDSFSCAHKIKVYNKGMNAPVQCKVFHTCLLPWPPGLCNHLQFEITFDWSTQTDHTDLLIIGYRQHSGWLILLADQ